MIIGGGASSIPSGQTPTALVLNIGCGSSYPELSAVSGSLMDIRGEFSHTSGDARCIYSRLYLTGSVGGESARLYTTVNANLDTARGAHISLDFKAEAGGSECSGLGVAATFTLHIPDIASWAPTGTYAAIQAQLWGDGDLSDPAGMTSLAFFNVDLAGGDTAATACADIDDDAVLFDFTGEFTTTKNDGNMLMIEGDEPTWDNVTAYIKIKIKGTVYYLLAVPAVAQD